MGGDGDEDGLRLSKRQLAWIEFPNTALSQNYEAKNRYTS